MLSSSSRYAIRALLYLAGREQEKGSTGIREISSALGLPAPFLAKILQQLAKNKILSSVKGPNGGFSMQRKPESLTLYEIVKIIDGDDVFKNCLIHDGSCSEVKRSKKVCTVHEEYSVIRREINTLFRNTTLAKLAGRAAGSDNIFI
ncbi:MAG: Rrf2 family transcriptional regulator [Bacteroidales bacterium]|jgi:Rrf2 family protein|nr:Rrf2 family transcriptional regulator [Bacteroidales bacterium]